MFKGYRTVAVAVLMFIAYALAWPELTKYLDAQIIAIATTAVMFALRLLTSTPVFKAK